MLQWVLPWQLCCRENWWMQNQISEVLKTLECSIRRSDLLGLVWRFAANQVPLIELYSLETSQKLWRGCNGMGVWDIQKLFLRGVGEGGLNIYFSLWGREGEIEKTKDPFHKTLSTYVLYQWVDLWYSIVWGRWNKVIVKEGLLNFHCL